MRALLLVDFVNPLDFPGAEALAPGALEAARAAAQLQRRLAARGVPAIWVNDNFGRWQSDFGALVRECRAAGGAAASLARVIAPVRRRGAAVPLTVLKPRHSAFYATPLVPLLDQLRVRELVITGLATDLCVMFTAMDAFVRGYRVWVPADCTAAESEERKQRALDWMKLALRARVTPAATRRTGKAGTRR